MRQLIDVIGQGQGHYIRFQSINHRTGLLAATAMGLVDGDAVGWMINLPVTRKNRVVRLVKLAGWIIGDIQQGLICCQGKGSNARHQSQKRIFEEGLHELLQRSTKKWASRAISHRKPQGSLGVEYRSKLA